MRASLKAHAILATSLFLCLPSIAGVPMSKVSNQMMRWGQYSIDTEDVRMYKQTLRFHVIRIDSPTRDNYSVGWGEALFRVNCRKFKTNRSIRYDLGQYGILDPWTEISPDTLAYTLATNFCYLTGEPGFTPEPNQPEVVKKIINTIITKYREKVPERYRVVEQQITKPVPIKPNCGRVLHEYDCSYNKYLEANPGTKVWADANPALVTKERIKLRSVD